MVKDNGEATAARNGHFITHLRKNVQYITNVVYFEFAFKMLLFGMFCAP